MLTTDQKEAILRKAGMAVPEFPTSRSEAKDHDRNEQAHDTPRSSVERRQAIEEWAAAVQALYVEYVARRAAKSLRDAEEARQLAALQRAGERSRA